MVDAAIHRVSGNAFDLSLRLLTHSGLARAFSPRDDKVRGSDVGGSVITHFLSLREGQNGRRGNPSCLVGGGQVCGLVVEEKRIPTLFAFVFVPSCRLNHFPASQQ